MLGICVLNMVKSSHILSFFPAFFFLSFSKYGGKMGLKFKKG